MAEISELRGQGQERENLKGLIAEVNNLLDPIIKKYSILKLVKEYYKANLGSVIEGMVELNDRVENLGVVDEVTENNFRQIQKESTNTTKIIEETAPKGELNVLDMAKKLRDKDPQGLLEKNIFKVYGVQVNSWEIFIQWLNLALKQDPFIWDSLRKSSEQL